MSLVDAPGRAGDGGESLVLGYPVGDAADHHG
jgi:hypothetical protein